MALLDAFDVVATRCATITSNTVKWDRDFNTDETPGISVYIDGQMTIEDDSGRGGRLINIPIAVTYHKESTTDNPTIEGASMVEALLAAIEVDDPRSGCSFIVGGPMDIVTPADNSGIISVRILFNTTKNLSYGGV